jgi:hypothetical protein
MAFDFLAAAAGFTRGAADAIEERNKELAKSALDEVEIARKSAGEQNAKLRTKRDDLRATAEVLSSYSNAGGKFTEAQVAGLLQKPAVAKQVMEKLKSAKSLEDIDFNKIYEVSEGKTDATIDDVITRMTSIPKAEASAPTPSPRGAFGLPTKAYSESLAAGEREAGASLTELRATARGVPMLTKEEEIGKRVDMSQFDEPAAIATIKNKLGDNMAKGIKLTDPANEKLLKRLQANAVITDMFDKDKGEGAAKPRTTSAISSIFSKSLAVSVDPFVVKGVVRLVPETGDYVPVGGSVEDIAAFQKQKNDTIKAQAEAIGIVDKQGKIIGGQNASDALIPYANIEDGQIKSWKTVAKGETPAGGGTGKPTVSEAPLAIPKTADGKSIDATKMVAGQKYKSADGTIKTWNGMGWQ